jgi:hypothetical protein
LEKTKGCGAIFLIVQLVAEGDWRRHAVQTNVSAIPDATR